MMSLIHWEVSKHHNLNFSICFLTSQLVGARAIGICVPMGHLQRLKLSNLGQNSRGNLVYSLVVNFAQDNSNSYLE